MPTIDLCGEEVLDAINSLDTYSRVWMGQFSHLDLVWRMWRFTTYSQSRESRICEELLMADIGKDYRSLALERADSGEPLTHGERRNARLT